LSWNSVTTLLVRGLHSMQYSRPSTEDLMKSKHSCNQAKIVTGTQPNLSEWNTSKSEGCMQKPKLQLVC
jgi:hypothetical protein